MLVPKHAEAAARRRAAARRAARRDARPPGRGGSLPARRARARLRQTRPRRRAAGSADAFDDLTGGARLDADRRGACRSRAPSRSSCTWRTSRRSITGAAPAHAPARPPRRAPTSSLEGRCRAWPRRLSPARLRDAVLGLRIELVMTAHPTEMMRRTLQRKYNAIADALDGLDRPDVTPLERQALVDTLRREITAAWETEEMRRDRPSPLDEVRSALASSNTPSGTPCPIPAVARPHARAVTGSGLPLDAAPIRFGSWIGGDRDGNPSITPEVTRRACLASRWIALTMYARDVAALAKSFDVGREPGAPRLHARCVRAVSRAPAHGPARARVDAARRRRAALVAARRPRRRPAGERSTAPRRSDAPLQLCFDSLHETGNGLIADGPLADVLRRLACFGLTSSASTSGRTRSGTRRRSI